MRQRPTISIRRPRPGDEPPNSGTPAGCAEPDLDARVEFRLDADAPPSRMLEAVARALREMRDRRRAERRK
jgi:hypothetical protein